jgi:hypothetical protein
MTAVAVFIGIFFAIGLVVGVITVIAVSVLGQDKKDRRAGRETWEPDDDLPPDFGWARTPGDLRRWNWRESDWPQRRDG